MFAGRACLFVKYVVGPPPPAPPCCGAVPVKLLKIDSGAGVGGVLERVRRCGCVTRKLVVVVPGRGRRWCGWRMLGLRDCKSRVVRRDAPSIFAVVGGCLGSGRVLEVESELFGRAGGARFKVRPLSLLGSVGASGTTALSAWADTHHSLSCRGTPILFSNIERNIHLPVKSTSPWRVGWDESSSI